MRDKILKVIEKNNKSLNAMEIMNQIMENSTIKDYEELMRELEKLCSMKSVGKKQPVTRVNIKPLKFSIYESVMRDKIGTKVQINKNKILIPFDSEGDLARILEILDIDVSKE